MTGHHAPGAPSAPLQWDAIDWPSIQRKVYRLQTRIAKAEKEKRYGKVKALQWLLARSFSAKLWAVRRVVSNNGKRTPGVDGVLWRTPGERLQAARSLRKRGYQPQPLKRIYIPKKNGKLRPLSIPTMHDRAMQALYLLALNPVAEIRADPNSYGFRPYRSTADALGQCFCVFAKKQSPRVVFDADIQACFDRISHAWLLANVPMDKTILRKWLAAGYMEDTVLYPTEEGTPQGGIISPVLANLTLDGLERVAREALPRRSLVNVVRYADDFVVTARTPEQLRDKVIPAIEAFLAERGLQLSPEKSRITDIETGFDFLGVNVRKYDGTLLMKPSPKSVKAFLDGIRECIKAHFEIPMYDLIRLLNPRIRGWANYYRHMVSSRVFRKVDNAIFDAMMRWMKRKHPRKSLAWLRKRYFRSNGSRHWIMTAKARKTNGTAYQIDLFQASSLAIRRHVKVQAEASAYDPAYTAYFHHRWEMQRRIRRDEARRAARVSGVRDRDHFTQPGRVKPAYAKA